MTAALPRLALWFDNPNKAAVLLACLALVFLAGLIRAKRIPSAVLLAAAFTAAGTALVLTASRGGLLAFACGAIPVLVVNRGRLIRPSLAFVAVLTAAAACYLAHQDVSGRFRPSALTDDGAVTNRLLVWQAAPAMMADAPAGWGLGRSGAAFMGWYQPLDRHEEYRTLVSSHLTYLVEFGRAGRLAYATLWLFVLALGVLAAKLRREPLPLAVWTCLAVAAAFTSVLEAKELWILPAFALVPAVRPFLAREAAPFRRLVVAFALLGGAALVAGLEAYGRRNRPPAALPLADDGRCITVGDGVPDRWITLDETVMGGGACGRRLRVYAKDRPGFTCGIARTLADVPAGVRRLAVCGHAADRKAVAAFRGLESLRVLSPADPTAWQSAEKPPTRIFLGEFSPVCPEDDFPGLTVVPGTGVYLPEWPAYAFD